MSPELIPQSAASGGPVRMRCPQCRSLGVFSVYHNMPDMQFAFRAPGQAPIQLGIRGCPNAECLHPVFVIIQGGQHLIASYPPERLDFDASKIPPAIVTSFEEAIADHANQCFRSAAIMVRRTLEEICQDKKVTGKDLKDRLKALQTLIVVPRELMEAADELRVLGNDAAHIEARVYDDIGREEVEVAIELGKELLKAVYQLDVLVNRLRALKNKPTGPAG